MSQASFYKWKTKYGGMDASLMKRLKELVRENALIVDWLLRLTQAHKRWGFGLCFMYLRNVKGYCWNHKRVYRIYRDLELNLRIKPKRRINRTARHEWLDLHLFESIEHAQLLATQWLWTYNNERPHSAIGGIPPRQLLNVA